MAQTSYPPGYSAPWVPPWYYSAPKPNAGIRYQIERVPVPVPIRVPSSGATSTAGSQPTPPSSSGSLLFVVLLIAGGLAYYFLVWRKHHQKGESPLENVR